MWRSWWAGVTPWFANGVRAGKGTFTDEIKDAGFELVKEIPLIEGQYFLVFEKRTFSVARSRTDESGEATRTADAPSATTGGLR